MKAPRSEANEETALREIAEQLGEDRATCKARWYRDKALETMHRRIAEHAAAKERAKR